MQGDDAIWSAGGGSEVLELPDPVYGWPHDDSDYGPEEDKELLKSIMNGAIAPSEDQNGL